MLSQREADLACDAGVMLLSDRGAASESPPLPSGELAWPAPLSPLPRNFPTPSQWSRRVALPPNTVPLATVLGLGMGQRGSFPDAF